MELSDVIAARRSVRELGDDPPVTDEDVRALLEAAIVAPSAGNLQPWRFFVVRSAQARERLGRALRQAWVAQAPAVIVVGADESVFAERYHGRGESLYAIQDTAAAAEHVLLTAVDRGLASCWVGAFDEAAVAEAVGITAPVRPVAILPIGRGPAPDSPRSRRPIEEVSVWL